MPPWAWGIGQEVDAGIFAYGERPDYEAPNTYRASGIAATADLV